MDEWGIFFFFYMGFEDKGCVKFFVMKFMRNMLLV